MRVDGAISNGSGQTGYQLRHWYRDCGIACAMLSHAMDCVLTLVSMKEKNVTFEL